MSRFTFVRRLVAVAQSPGCLQPACRRARRGDLLTRRSCFRAPILRSAQAPRVTPFSRRRVYLASSAHEGGWWQAVRKCRRGCRTVARAESVLPEPGGWLPVLLPWEGAGYEVGENPYFRPPPGVEFNRPQLFPIWG